MSIDRRDVTSPSPSTCPLPCPSALFPLPTRTLSPHSSLGLSLFTLFRLVPTRSSTPTTSQRTSNVALLHCPQPLRPPCVSIRFLSVAPVASFHVILFSHYPDPSCLRCPSGPLSSPLSSRLPPRTALPDSSLFAVSTIPLSYNISVVFWQSRSHLFAQTELRTIIPYQLISSRFPFRTLFGATKTVNCVILLCLSLFFLSLSPPIHVIYLRVLRIFLDCACKSSLLCVP